MSSRFWPLEEVSFIYPLHIEMLILNSPYDGKTWNDADDIQIDHMVPLANAWR